ncbi:hypothetical protein LLG90_22725 [Aromatoleum toluclasticum]|uniref:hypothetical protein n=1 Tax=Aromatoleum toluclasticum TaxID=92003 RepID=UPI001D1970E5|nr:hypothetical protein [Aromatoleum toluclasticum]MCC4118171.1 hypothetical protein [Aromatoleum toluclasticum]
MTSFDPRRSYSARPALPWFSLLLSTGTLVCCALPILLVSFGLGAAFASLIAAFPVLVALAEHKAWVFGLSAVLLATAGYSTFRPGRSCPPDPALAARCERAHRLSVWVFCVALSAWGIGFITAYVALPVRIWLGY